MEQEDDDDDDENGIEIVMMPKHKEYTFNKRLLGISLMFVSSLGWAFLGFIQSYLFHHHPYISI